MRDPDTTNEFAKPRVLNFQVEVLRAVLQQMVIKRGMQVVLDAGRSEAWLSRVYRDIACIVGKTYAERGDDAQLADDTALLLIREILLTVDESIFESSKDRKLPRKYRRMLPSPTIYAPRTVREE